MKPAAFDYLKAASVDEVLAALAEHGEEARVLAGGQSLMAMLNMRLVTPRLVIDIAHIPALAEITVGDGKLTVGAGVTQAQLQRRPRLAEELPLVARALPSVGHYQTRNRGTVCGSIAHADPSAELPLCLVALGGEVVLRARRGGRRVVPAEHFFRGLLSTDRRPTEIVEAVRFPLARPGEGHAFAEVARRHGDFALVALAVLADSRRIRLTVGGVADRPVAREWPLDVALDDALNEFAWALGGDDDQHATGRYRRDLVRRLGRKVVREALSCR